VLWGAAALVLVLVVGAMTGRPWSASSEGTGGGSSLTDATSRLVLIAFIVLLVAGAAVLVLSASTKGPSRSRLPRQPLWRQLIALVLFVVVAALVARDRSSDEDAVEQPAVPTTGTDAGVASDPPEEDDRPSTRQRDLAAILVIAAGAGGLLLAGAALRRTTHGQIAAEPEPEAGPAPSPDPRVHALVRRSLADLRAEPDPRAAIIACYERLDGGLDTLGYGRRHNETPGEWLARSLALPAVPGSDLTVLTRLYQEARYSRHPLTTGHRDVAVAALTVVLSSIEGHVEADHS